MGQTSSIPPDQITAQWVWKSNQQPFSSAEAQWTAYTPVENALIENAFLKKKKKVDIGDYIISISHMLQLKKGDVSAQRDIQRIPFDQNQNQNQIKVFRSERFFEVEPPKTLNKPFGDILIFLAFLQKQNLDIKNFADLLNEIIDSQNIDDLNRQILPCLIACFEDELKKFSKTKDKILLQKREFYLKQISDQFKQELPSLNEFYTRILKVYTMNGFLYENINFYLRNEDWVGIRCLLPYAYCLFKAFFHLQLFSRRGSLHQKQPEVAQQNNAATMLVYRGAQFERIALSFYDLDASEFFSWNGVTSTSTSLEVAKEFMLDPNNLDPNKVSVLFTIEIPRELSNAGYANWISVQPFTEFPHEDEIIIAPGSVFQMTEELIKHNNFVEIKLKLVTDIERLINQGQVLHGPMHSKMSDVHSFQIMCHEGKYLAEALGHLRGNLLLQELELGLCKFNNRTLDKLLDTLKTVSNLNKLVFISPSSTDETHFSKIFEQLKKSLCLKTLEIYDKTTFSNQNQISFAQGIGSFNSLLALTLDFTRSVTLRDETIKHLCSDGIKRLSALLSLDLSFERCSHITDKGIKALCSKRKGIKRLSQVKFLALNFTGCEKITDKGLERLKIINSLSSIKSTKLNFTQCRQITDVGLEKLCLKEIKPLTSLDLNFAMCSKITDKGLLYLFPKNSISLETLSLNFEGCEKITSQGLLSLFPKEIKSFKALHSLAVKLAGCDKITDEGLRNLGSQGVKHLISLQYLGLDLTSCLQITNRGIEDLFTQGIECLDSMPLFNINCSLCPFITDHKRETLQKASKAAAAIMEDKKLKVMSFQREIQGRSGDVVPANLQKSLRSNRNTLVFDSDEERSNFFVDAFSEDGLEYIQSIKNMGIHTEVFPVLNHLNQLLIKRFSEFTSLKLLEIKFAKNDQITSSWLNSFFSQKIANLKSITLDFSRDNKISDEWLTLSQRHVPEMASIAVEILLLVNETIKVSGHLDLCQERNVGSNSKDFRSWKKKFARKKMLTKNKKSFFLKL